MSYKAGTDQQGSTVWHALLVGDNSRDGVKHGMAFVKNVFLSFHNQDRLEEEIDEKDKYSTIY